MENSRPKPTVLVVDDVPTVRESLAIALEDAGFEVASAGNGREALDLLGQREFDVLVTDMWMPEMDGLRLLKEIRGTRPKMRVFGVTGGGPRLTIETMSSLAEVWGAERVFLKPFDDDELIAAILAPRPAKGA
ncbi:response regulator [Aureimonas endophytica]|uniref:Response regulator n=1 Tax=Aureimonas endophytica TaxID=2027858 RepID=A0A916ZKL2_9HYPH|nr:response regulator [Aureimonas endophytica]GGE00798.1 response regulator [Aureimonas endophytica]